MLPGPPRVLHNDASPRSNVRLASLKHCVIPDQRSWGEGIGFYALTSTLSEIEKFTPFLFFLLLLLSTAHIFQFNPPPPQKKRQKLTIKIITKNKTSNISRTVVVATTTRTKQDFLSACCSQQL